MLWDGVDSFINVFINRGFSGTKFFFFLHDTFCQYLLVFHNCWTLYQRCDKLIAIQLITLKTMTNEKNLDGGSSHNNSVYAKCSRRRR